MLGDYDKLDLTSMITDLVQFMDEKALPPADADKMEQAVELLKEVEKAQEDGILMRGRS